MPVSVSEGKTNSLEKKKKKKKKEREFQSNWFESSDKILLLSCIQQIIIQVIERLFRSAGSLG